MFFHMFAAGVLAGFSCLLTPTLKKGEKRGEIRLVLAKLASPSSVRQKRRKNVILPNVTCLLLTS
jgi:hypothetical protein